MFIFDSEKKCLKQKNYKDLEIAVSEFINLNELITEGLSDIELTDIASTIEVIYKDVYCEKEENSDLIDLIEKMLTVYTGTKAPIYSQSDLEYINLKIEKLKTIPQPEQRSPEWYTYRNNRLTASDLWYIMDDNDAKIYDILKKKCGIEKKFMPGAAILHGVMCEPIATHIYETRNQVEIVEFGCLPHSFIPYFGASPDGICGYNSENKNYIGRMLEIKCPKSRVITGFIPEVYRAQMQGQLEVCDLEYCDFLECDIKYYSSRAEFLDDVYTYTDEQGIIVNDFSRTAKGNEKGAVFEMLDTATKATTYEYCYKPLPSNDAIKAWEDPFIDKVIDSETLEHTGTTYWYLNNMSTVLVKRDREWFNTNFYKIKKFWEKVEDARTNGVPERKKKEVEPEFKITDYIGTQQAPKIFETVIEFGGETTNN